VHQERCVLALLAFACAVSGPARADVIDTFDNDVNLGTWRLTTNPNRLYRIEPTGGNPGAYLHGQVATAVPTWYVSNPVGNPFLGDYAAEGVSGFSCDMTISGGIQVPDRNLTLHLLTTLGTGDPSLGIEAYFVGADISQFPVGWRNYSYPLAAGSATIPAGWVVTEGNGMPGTDADWRMLVRHVEDVHMALGTPGFFYPNIGVWDLGLDNVTLSTVPGPGASVLAAVGALSLLWRWRRVV
jgi:hypothetical protein